jgi:hypothetical protein
VTGYELLDKLINLTEEQKRQEIDVWDDFWADPLIIKDVRIDKKSGEVWIDVSSDDAA